MANFTIKYGATRPALTDTLLADGDPINLTGCTVALVAYKYGVSAINSTGTIVNATAGTVRYNPVAADTNVLGAGTYAAQWKVTFGDATIQYIPSYPFSIEVTT